MIYIRTCNFSEVKWTPSQNIHVVFLVEAQPSISFSMSKVDLQEN